MTFIKPLFERLQASSFEARYPEFNLIDGKTHILYVSPVMDQRGLYRSILPYFVLNQSPEFSVILTDLQKVRFDVDFDSRDCPIDARLIEWAHYIVFPIFFDALRASGLPKWLQELKRLNPRLRLVMDIDHHFHLLPSEHPSLSFDKNKIAFKAKKGALLYNLSQMDVITCATREIRDYYEKAIKRAFFKKTKIHFLPNLISSFGFDGINELSTNTTDTVRIGIMATRAHHYDLATIVSAVFELQQEYDDQVQFILIGSDGFTPDDYNLFSQVHVTIADPMAAVDTDKKSYLCALNDLELDLAMLPLADNIYNKNNAVVDFLELSALGIPCVAAKLLATSLLIKDPKNGLLAENVIEWFEKVSILIEQPKLRAKIAHMARVQAWKLHGFSTKNLELFREAFPNPLWFSRIEQVPNINVEQISY